MHGEYQHMMISVFFDYRKFVEDFICMEPFILIIQAADICIRELDIVFIIVNRKWVWVCHMERHFGIVVGINVNGKQQ